MYYRGVICSSCGWEVCQSCGCCYNDSCELASCPCPDEFELIGEDE